jgi:hypothetical protein
MLILQILAGIVIAVAVDWSIYTHLSAYLRVGVPRTRALDYSVLAGERPIQWVRTAAVALSGALAGFAFASREPSLWLASALLFTLAHSLIYLLLYKR